MAHNGHAVIVDVCLFVQLLLDVGVVSKWAEGCRRTGSAG